MATEYDALKQALSQANTPEARQKAAQALQNYVAANPHNSKPMLVSLGLDGSTQIAVKDLPQAIQNNPALFEKLKKIVGA